MSPEVLSPEVFLAIAQILPTLVKSVFTGLEQVTLFIRTLQATAEQEQALLVIARAAVLAEQRNVRAAPRLDPSDPHKMLPEAT